MYDDAHTGCATLRSYRKKGTLPPHPEKKEKTLTKYKRRVFKFAGAFSHSEIERDQHFHEIMNLFRIRSMFFDNR